MPGGGPSLLLEAELDPKPHLRNHQRASARKAPRVQPGRAVQRGTAKPAISLRAQAPEPAARILPLDAAEPRSESLRAGASQSPNSARAHPARTRPTAPPLRAEGALLDLRPDPELDEDLPHEPGLGEARGAPPEGVPEARAQFEDQKSVKPPGRAGSV